MLANMYLKTDSAVCSLRILRWIDEEEDRLKASGEDNLHYVILDMTGKTISWKFDVPKYLMGHVAMRV